MTNLQSFGPDIPPPPRKSYTGRGAPKSPECEAAVALAVGGYMIVPPAKVTKALATSAPSMWGKRYGMRFKTFRTAGDAERGIEPNSLVIQRVQ